MASFINNTTTYSNGSDEVPCPASPTDWSDKVETLYQVMMVFNLSMAVFITFGNSLIVIAILRYPEIRSTTNLGIGSMAVSDLLAGCLYAPVYSMVHYLPYGLQGNKQACLWSVCLINLILMSSILHLACISFDRFIAIVHPLHYYTWVTERRVSIVLFLVWSFCIFMFTLPFAGWNGYQDGCNLCLLSVIFPQALNVILGVVVSVSVTLTAFIYLRIGVVSYRYRHQVAPASASSEEDKSDSAKKNRKVNRMFAIILCTYYISWSPFLAFLIVKTYLSGKPTPEWVEFLAEISLGMTLINSAINPAVYAWHSPEFARAFRKIITCKE